VSLDPPKSTFSTDYISAPRGCWLLKFLHALEFEQALVANIAIGFGGPLKNFKGQHMRAYNFGSSEHNLTKFYKGMWLIAGVITLSLILQGVPLQNLGG